MDVVNLKRLEMKGIRQLHSCVDDIYWKQADLFDFVRPQ
jgi:hypothetical protein